MSVRMFERVRQWYEGEGKVMEFDHEPHSPVVFMPGVYTEYHWTARVARAIVAFYKENWQFLWATSIAVVTAYIGYLAIPHG